MLFFPFLPFSVFFFVTLYVCISNIRGHHILHLIGSSKSMWLKVAGPNLRDQWHLFYAIFIFHRNHHVRLFVYVPIHKHIILKRSALHFLMFYYHTQYVVDCRTWRIRDTRFLIPQGNEYILHTNQVDTCYFFECNGIKYIWFHM